MIAFPVVPAALALIALAMWPLAVPSQAPPDISGRWVFAGDRSTPPAPNRASFGLEFTARIDSKQFTVERVAGTQKTVTVYPLDETEIEIRTSQAVTRTRARLEGNTIVMEVHTTPVPAADGTTTTTVSTRRLWIEGDTLISEWVIKSPRPSNTISIYKRPEVPR